MSEIALLFSFAGFSLMSHNDAIEFENAMDGSQPLRSEVVARWQRKIQDKSHRQGTVVRFSTCFLNNRRRQSQRQENHANGRLH